MSASPHGSGRGMLYICLSVFLFASMDVLSKTITRSYPVAVAVWARYFVHMMFMLLVLGPRLRLDLIRTQRLGLQVIRGLVLVTSTVFFYHALKFLPLSDASALGFTAPLMVVALSGPLLHEKISRGQWIAVGVGFLGVLIIMRPGSGTLSASALLPIGAAACYSVYQILTRKLSGRENPTATLFYTALVGTAATSVLLPFTWQTPTPIQALLLICMGLLGGFGHFLLIKAVDHAPPSTLAPVVYSQLIWATLYGILVFQEYPDAYSLLGMLIIVGAGLYTANWRTMRRGTDRVDQVEQH